VPQWGNMTQMRVLNLANNWLSGTLPAELGAMKELRGLSLHINQFTGERPGRRQPAPAAGSVGGSARSRLQQAA